MRSSISNLQLAYLPHRRKDFILDDENIDLYVSLDGNSETADDTSKEEKKTRKPGLLNWLKLRVFNNNQYSLSMSCDAAFSY